MFHWPRDGSRISTESRRVDEDDDDDDESFPYPPATTITKDLPSYITAQPI